MQNLSVNIWLGEIEQCKDGLIPSSENYCDYPKQLSSKEDCSSFCLNEGICINFNSMPMCTCPTSTYGVQCSYQEEDLPVKLNEIIRDIYVTTGDDIIQSIRDIRDFVQLRTLSKAIVQNKNLVNDLEDNRKNILTKTSKLIQFINLYYSQHHYEY